MKKNRVDADVTKGKCLPDVACSHLNKKSPEIPDFSISVELCRKKLSFVVEQSVKQTDLDNTVPEIGVDFIAVKIANF